MTLPLWCVFISAVLIFLARIPVGKAMKGDAGGYDNHHPRAQQARLTGLGARALAAHQNSLEAFPLFAVGVLVAMVTQSQGLLINALAVTFVISRILFIVFYCADKPAQRSLCWFVGLLCSLLLMLAPLLV
ncbi:MAPEG family protein [Pseudomonas sp. N040]|uniref:MAPEG family protein n=1 Tax=Pseudomonas sp. N040 TaxID=2785325 RepID=UPI0018A27331|nr:MAPEG family protein [Pseudomonas sp. N040]MBF7730679.1 MAPEG family protein [Pseudomonas sp. N040]MBW7014322.1 MAPEG family protein [Pseudomonas sp. N040]